MSKDTAVKHTYIIHADGWLKEKYLMGLHQVLTYFSSVPTPAIDNEPSSVEKRFARSKKMYFLGNIKCLLLSIDRIWNYN